MERVVIVGGGFGGLNVARGLRRAPVTVTVIDRTNHHLFQPLLYQVATGALSPADIAAPIRWVLRRQRNATVLLAEVDGFDLEAGLVHTSAGDVGFDTLVVAAGATTSYFGNDRWEEHAPGLKTLTDATEVRRRVLTSFEAAELASPPEVGEWLTFVVVGGGPTGCELAGAIAELARDTLRSDFRRVDPRASRIMLVEGGERVLDSYPPGLSASAQHQLEGLGVEVVLGRLATDIHPGGVILDDGQEIASRCVLWAAGVAPSPLAAALAEGGGIRLEGGRVVVDDTLRPCDGPIYVIGDMAHLVQDGTPLPGIAPVAMQQGRHVARSIAAVARAEELPRFRYRDRGQLATIGRSAAVADLGPLHFGGFLAWMLWLLVHIMYLAGFLNRLLVLIQWSWNYVTRNRTARLILRRAPGPGD